MALQNSGQITLNDIVNEFGDKTPSITKLSEFYGAGKNIPSSGTIKFSDFYGSKGWSDGYPKTATTSNANLLWVPTNERGTSDFTISNGGLDFIVPPTSKIVALMARGWYDGSNPGSKIWFLDLDDLMQGTFTSVGELRPSDMSSPHYNSPSIIITDITDTHFIIRGLATSGQAPQCFLFSYSYDPNTQSYSNTQQQVYLRPSANNTGTSDWHGKIPKNDIIFFQAETASNGSGRLYQYDFSGNLVETYDPSDFDDGNYWSANLSYNKKYISIGARVEFGNEKWRTKIFEYDSNGLVEEVVNRVVGSNSYEPAGRLRKNELFNFFGNELIIKSGTTAEFDYYDSGGKTFLASDGLKVYDYEEFDANGNLDYAGYKLDSWHLADIPLTGFDIGKKISGYVEMGFLNQARPIVMSDEYMKVTRLIGTWGRNYSGSSTDHYYAQLIDIHNDSIHFYYGPFDLHDFRSDISAQDAVRFPRVQNIIAREEGVLINALLKDSASSYGYSGFGLAIPRN